MRLTYKPLVGASLKPGHPLINGLQRYWPMNESAGPRIVDLVGSDIGSLQPGTSWDGEGVRFDGINGDITISVSSIHYTIVVLMKTESGSTGQLLADNVANNQFRSNGDGNIQFLTVSGADFNLTSTGATVTDGEWHVAVGRNSLAGSSLFIDGSLRASGAAAVASRSWTQIGSRGATEPYSGSIGMVAYYTRALSDSEIQQLSWNPFSVINKQSVRTSLYGTSTITPITGLRPAICL